jgi:hypothetical protein
MTFEENNFRIHSVIASQFIIFLSLCQLSKKLKTRTSNCTILFVVLCGYEIWLLTLEEKKRPVEGTKEYISGENILTDNK